MTGRTSISHVFCSEFRPDSPDKLTLCFQSQKRLQLQLAPSLEHQVAAMLSILVRYNWRQFSVVTSAIAGHDDFVQSVRDKVALMRANGEFR